MTPTAPGPRPSSRSPLRIAGLAAVVAVAALAGGGLWYLFGREAPAKVSLGTAAPTAGAPSASPGATTPATPGGSPSGPATGDLSGTWSVDPSIGSFADFTGSFVGYRVQEELATIGATTAVGRTPDVTGSLTLDGTTITAAEITADLSTLESDDSRRDGQLRRQALETGTYPTATFVLTEPIELGTLPAEGVAFAATAVGDLTLHGVTRRIELPLEARLADGVVTVIGSTQIAFADYAIDPPRAGIVLSVDDVATMELKLQLTRS